MAFIDYNGTNLDLQEFLTSAANQVQQYVNSQPWSNKRKQSFLNAYSDIMNHGVIGASIGSDGLWSINHNGTIDQSLMSKMDKQMYGEAAYFIQQQMLSLGTKEETPKEETKLIDYGKLLDRFGNYVSDNRFGGREWSISLDWNTLDTRDESTGLLNNTNRLNTLKELLTQYRDSLEEGKYNFEGSPFKDLNDLKTRIYNAIAGLDSGDINAINLIGLNPKDWFYNGSSDIAGTDAKGNLYTYALLAEIKKAQADALAKEEAAKLAAQRKANNGVNLTLGGIHAVEARNNPQGYEEFLANTYGVGEQGFNNVNQRVLQLIDKVYSVRLLNNAEKKELGNLLYYIRSNNDAYKTSNLSDQEWKELSTHKLSDTNRNNYIHLPWKTVDGRNVYVDGQGNIHILKNRNNAQLPSAFKKNPKATEYRKNFLGKTSVGLDKQQEDYLKSIGFNTADIAELTGIGLDIASIVDPEPFSAGGLGIGAAIARTVARNQDPKARSAGEWFTTGLDYLTGGLGAIPGIGDAILAGKTIGKIAKWGKRALTIPAVADMLYQSPGALAAVNKAINGEKLTVQDYKNLGGFIRGLTATRNITVLNRAARRAMEKRGYDLSEQNGILKRTGLLDTSVPTTQATVKVNIKGKEQEIAISPQSKKKLDEDLKKAGNNQTKKDEAIRKVKEVKEHITTKKLKNEDVTALESSSLRNARFVPRYFGTTTANYGTAPITRPSGTDTFNSYLENRGLWNKLVYGSNRTIKAFDPLKGVTTLTPPPTLNNQPTSTLNSSPSPTLTPQPTNKLKLGRPTLNKEQRKELRTTFAGKNYSSNNNLDEDILELRGFGDIYRLKNSDGTYTIRFELKNKPHVDIEVSADKLKEETLKLIKRTMKGNKIKASTKLLYIRDLKAKGFLKQGGQINYIDKTISEFLNKLR